MSSMDLMYMNALLITSMKRDTGPAEIRQKDVLEEKLS